MIKNTRSSKLRRRKTGIKGVVGIIIHAGVCELGVIVVKCTRFYSHGRRMKIHIIPNDHKSLNPIAPSEQEAVKSPGPTVGSAHKVLNFDQPLDSSSSGF